MLSRSPDWFGIPVDIIGSSPGPIVAQSVEGNCMNPIINDNDRLLIDVGRPWTPGDIVCFRFPSHRKPYVKRLVKRGRQIAFVADNGSLEVLRCSPKQADAMIIGVIVGKVSRDTARTFTRLATPLAPGESREVCDPSAEQLATALAEASTLPMPPRGQVPMLLARCQADEPQCAWIEGAALAPRFRRVKSVAFVRGKRWRPGDLMLTRLHTPAEDRHRFEVRVIDETHWRRCADTFAVSRDAVAIASAEPRDAFRHRSRLADLGEPPRFHTGNPSWWPRLDPPSRAIADTI